MDNQLFADEIIFRLLQKPRPTADLDFVQQAGTSRRHRDWNGALRQCERGARLAAAAGQDEDYLNAVVDLCKGTICQAQEQLTQAVRHYENARVKFGLVDDAHGEGVALLALGLAYRASYDDLEAETYLVRSHDMFAQLGERHRRDPELAHLYADLTASLQGRREDIREQNRSNESLICRGVSRAGEPAYSPDVDVIADEVNITGDEFELLDPITRRPRYMGFPLHAGNRYFVTRVDGASMTYPDDTGIHDGDSVLVRECSWVDDGRTAVVRIDEHFGSATVVKRIGRQRGHVILESANPDFPPREFGTESPALEILGEVVAILRQQ